MTFESMMKDYLVSRGMLDSQADAVIANVKALNETAFMSSVWNKNPNNYSVVMTQSIIMVTKLEAIKWIDKNLPLAFYRPMFAENDAD